MFPYDEYAARWVIGFVYRRVAVDAGAANRMYTISELAPEPAPIANVEVFIQEKWRVAGDRTGGGNTTNTGSITGTLSDFQQGNGVFQSESESWPTGVGTGAPLRNAPGGIATSGSFA